ncbi:MFS transporter [Janthinobacterium rivuli]|uniref:MFS transporter n=1 Tax=Janthinobacterium rivuli TaxID=2751478 RepID=UPI00383A89D1
MLSYPFSQWLARRGVHFAWVIVAITFLTALTSSAALGLPGALMQPLSREFGWDAEQISSALAVRFVLFGLMGPFAAILMERFGLRNVICVALVLSAVVANRWFETHRGLVVGVLTASSATGQLLFLPVGAWLIEHYGWRTAVMPVFIACAVVAVLAFLCMRNRPQDVALRPYGADPATPLMVAPAAKMTFVTPFLILRSVASNRTFWILFGTFFICGLSTNGLIQTHFISLCGDSGLSAVPAASVLAMMGAFDLFGTILSGWLSDRYDNRKLLFWYYGLRGLSLFWLPYSEFTLYGLSLFAMFYGLDWIATVPPTVKLVGATFGRERAGMVFGWIFAGHQLGAAVAAYGAGRIRTLMLTYNPALFAAGAACLVAALMVLAIQRQKAAVATAQPA